MSKRELKALGITSLSTQPPVDPPPPFSFLDLPEDLQRAVLNRLPLRDKIQAQPVCKDFRRLLLTEADAGSWGSVSIRKSSEDMREDFGPRSIVTWSGDGGDTSLMFCEKYSCDEATGREDYMRYDDFLYKVVKWLVRGGEKGGRRLERLFLDLRIVLACHNELQPLNTARIVKTLRDAGFEGVLYIQEFNLYTYDGDTHAYEEKDLQSTCDALSRSETFTTEIQVVSESDDAGKGNLRALSRFVQSPRVRVVGLVLKELWAKSKQVLNQVYPMLAPTLRRLRIYVPDLEGQGCPALTSLTALSNLEELVINGRAILSAMEVSAVASLSASLRRLEVLPEEIGRDHPYVMQAGDLPAGWAQLGHMVSGLSRLTELDASLPPVQDIPFETLASLPPLRLPSGRSQELKLGLRFPLIYNGSALTYLTLGCFETMSHVTSLTITCPYQFRVYMLRFAPTISHLGALRTLSVDTAGAGAMGSLALPLVFPPELSKCTALKEIRIKLAEPVWGGSGWAAPAALPHSVPGWARSGSEKRQEDSWGWEVWSPVWRRRSGRR